jgi:germacradienol/geosmin synthase
MAMQPFELPDFYVPWPARLNPNLDASRLHSKAWAQEMGILGAPESESSSKIWSEHDFDKHDYALLCAYIHPDVESLMLNLMTDWNVWAFYVDDYFFQFYKQPKDHKGAKKYLDRVLVFMPADLSPLPAATNPMERGLADLWLRTAPAKSEAWRSRIIESTRSLLQAFIWELDNISQQRLANPIEYIEMRRQVGAALWSADLVEHAMFVEIPDRIAATRPMQVLKSTFADAVHLRNDIFSYQREVVKQGEFTNAVLVIEHFLGVDTQRAVNLVNDLLTSRLQQFEHTVLTELEPLFEEYKVDPLEQANVFTYIRGLQDWQSGAHEWHIQTSRYMNPSAGQASTYGGFPIPGLSGLGTAAMRIRAGTLGLNRFKKYAHIPYQKVGPTRLPEFYMPFTPRINPHFETASRHSKAWARQMGMLDIHPGYPHGFIWDEHRFDVNDLALFNALCVPNATVDELNLDACWMVWGTYTDDYFAQVYGHTHNMVGARIFYARLLQFMPLDGTSQASIALTPTERGLAELWSLTTATLSVGEKCSFRKVIENMIGGWLWELSNRFQNRIPDLIDYIEIRHKISGSEFTLVLPGSVQGFGIPSEVYRTSTMQELSNAAIDYVWLTNDIFSYQMEIEFEGDIHNGVLIIQNFLGCDRMQAVEIANDLMTARMKQFEHIVMTELPILFDDFNLDDKAREQMLAYVEDRKQFMSGSLQWHRKTGRYKEIELLRHSPLPKPFAGTLTGLGTAAAHIQSAIRAGQIEPAQVEEASKDLKTFAVSHLAPPFPKKKEEAKAD